MYAQRIISHIFLLFVSSPCLAEHLLHRSSHAEGFQTPALEAVDRRYR